MRYLIVLLITCSLFAATLNLTQKEKDYLKEHPIITAHNEKDWVPYNYNIDGKPQGFSIEYMRLLASKIGFKVKFISGPTWNQFLQMTKEGKLDVMLNIAKTKKRMQYLVYASKYYQGIDVLFAKYKRYFNLSNLNGKTVAIVNGFYEEELMKEFYPDIKVLSVKSSEDALKAVLFGEADASIDNLATGNYLIRKYGFKNIEPIFEIQDSRFSLNLSLATSKTNTILRDILVKGQKLITQKEIIKLKKHWGMISKKNMQLTKAQQEYLRDKKQIFICIDPNWMPFEEFDKNGKYVGMSAEYFKIFSKNLGVIFKPIKTRSWNESLKFAKQRKCDMLSLAMSTADRKKYLNFTTPYLAIPLVVATRTDAPFFANFSTLKGHKLGIVSGYAFAEILRKKYPKLDIVDVKNIDDGLEKVADGKLFGFIGTLASIGYKLQHGYRGDIKISGKFDDKWKLGIGVRNDDKILLQIMQKGINSVTKKQKQAILNRWISIKYEKGVDYKLLWQVLIVFMLILLVITFFMLRQRKLKNQLQEANLLLEVSVDSTMEGIALFEDLRVVNSNKEIRKILRYDSEEGFLGKHTLEFVAPRSIEIVKKAIEKNQIEPYEASLLRKDGKEIPVLIKAKTIYVNNRNLRFVAAMDLSSQKEYEKNIIEARHKAEDALKIKSEFLSNISHEIRTPMNGIIGMTYLILQTPLNHKQQKYLNTIDSNAKYLLEIINNILDFSKIESGKLSINKVNFNLKNMLNDICNMMKPQATSKGLQFEIIYNHDLPQNTYTDSLRLSQILINLINNAIKFTDGGFVKIIVSHNGNMFRFEVKDSGIGLDKEQQKIIFNSFSQADGSTTRKYGGTGLGLSICKELIEMMEGKIWVESQKGVGSSFIFELILEEAQDVTSQIVDKMVVETQDKTPIDKTLENEILQGIESFAKQKRSKQCLNELKKIQKYRLSEKQKQFFDRLEIFIRKREYKNVIDAIKMEKKKID